MNPEVKKILLKFITIIVLSPLIGYSAMGVTINIKNALKQTGAKKWLSLAIAGFIIAILLGWIK